MELNTLIYMECYKQAAPLGLKKSKSLCFFNDLLARYLNSSDLRAQDVAAKAASAEIIGTKSLAALRDIPPSPFIGENL